MCRNIRPLHNFEPPATEEEMFAAAEELRFEYAAKLRDEIKELRRELLAVTAA